MTALETSLSLLAEGLWPVPVTAPDDPYSINPGKAPVGKGWGLKRHTVESLRVFYAAHPGAGLGLKLGPEGGVVDIDIDDPKLAGPVLARMFGGEPPHTRGWTSNRGHHWLFRWDERLALYRRALVKNHPAYPGVEVRIGWSSEGKQYQSVCPPSVLADGRAREWNRVREIAPLPASVFADLDAHLAEPEAPRNGRSAASKIRSILYSDVDARAAAYLLKCEPAVSGENGHDKAFKAACKVGPGFDLAPEAAFRLLKEIYNPSCVPPWSDKELLHKVEDAYKVEERRGWFLKEEPGRNGKAHANGKAHTPAPEDPKEDGGTEEDTSEEGIAVALLAPPPAEPAPPAEFFDDPYRLARSYVERYADHNGALKLRYWLEEWHRWEGDRYQVIPPAEMRASLVAHVKEEFDAAAAETGKPPARVTTGIVANVVQALTGICLLRQRECPVRPAWLGRVSEEMPSPLEVIPAQNGLVHLPALLDGRSGMLPPTPLFFSPNCLDYDFNPEAPRPDHWLAFLASVWGDDPESVASLQEWFGYLLTPDTSQQKILVLIGPTRSGKGTIAKVLSAVVGELNVASPTLSGMANNFGVAPLIGKTVAIFPDARLSGRADSQIIVERLLSVSGEDSQTIDRKHLSSWSGRLNTRFVLISNELPRLGDSSGAITARTVILRMTKSFLGREDTALQGKLVAELPSILLWSIAGWARLNRRGRFLQPVSGAELVDEMKELASPVGSFLEERCNLGLEHSIEIKVLYAAWKVFCADRGREHPGDEQGFGRSLRAALPTLKIKRSGSDGSRMREYIGIALRSAF